MTSSLVGSEMCIRDSGVFCREGSEVGPLKEQKQGGNGVFCREGSEAVSYTHLTLPTICSV
eukprot:6762056-Prorocentrum_lima.AAC.1